MLSVLTHVAFEANKTVEEIVTADFGFASRCFTGKPPRGTPLSCFNVLEAVKEKGIRVLCVRARVCFASDSGCAWLPVSPHFRLKGRSHWSGFAAAAAAAACRKNPSRVVHVQPFTLER